MTTYKATSASIVITKHPCILHGIIISDKTSTRGLVSLYDGVDTGSGKLLATLHCQANTSKAYPLYGIECKRGLYVTIGTNIHYAVVVFDFLSVGEVELSS